MSGTCIFCKIGAHQIQSKIIWEGADNLAFLTPFPNTAGFTVLASRSHKSSDVFALDDSELTGMILDAKHVAGLLKERLKVKRVGLIFEGYGIDHAHIKLVPMHGIEQNSWQQIASSPEDRKFYETYPGFIASHDGPPMEPVRLNAIYEKLVLV